jgi:hypothetical protein
MATDGSAGPIALSCPGVVPPGVIAWWCSCDQWGQWTKPGGAMFYNDVWGAGAGPQCTWVSADQWGTTANHPNTSGVKSYPNISFSPKQALSDINSYSSSFQVTVPTDGAWETTYDIWVKDSNSTRIEIMLWMNKNGPVYPASPSPTPAVPSVTTGGHTWNVYYGAFGGNQVVTLIRTTNTTSATVDIKDILDWIIANHGSFDSSWTLDQVQFGFEIVSNGSVQDFLVNSFSVSSE